jgi:hypothetical protein
MTKWNMSNITKVDVISYEIKESYISPCPAPGVRVLFNATMRVLFNATIAEVGGCGVWLWEWQKAPNADMTHPASAEVAGGGAGRRAGD